jgi:hypothetical protein
VRVVEIVVALLESSKSGTTVKLRPAATLFVTEMLSIVGSEESYSELAMILLKGLSQN